MSILVQKNKDQSFPDLGSPCFAICHWNLEHRNLWVWLSEFFRTQALCRIMGYRRDNFVSNNRLLRETGMNQVTCMIRQRQLRLFGHVVRFPRSDPFSRVILEEISLAWIRPRGRTPVTRLKRIDDHWWELGRNSQCTLLWVNIMLTTYFLAVMI